jgi:hypothetical protein
MKSLKASLIGWLTSPQYLVANRPDVSAGRPVMNVKFRAATNINVSFLDR